MGHRRRAEGTARRILPGVLLLVVGVSVAIGAPGVWLMSHQDPALKPIDEGVAVRLAEASADLTIGNIVGPALDPTPAVSPSQPDRTRTSPSTSAPAPGVSALPKRESSAVPSTTTPARSRQSPAPRATAVSRMSSPAMSVPARLLIGAIGIDAPVEAVGVDDNGDMAVPARVQQIGWYRFGAAPGSSAGSVVMSGHVDSAQQGLGAFSRLGELRSGDAITVTDGAGRTARYHVVGREAFDKKAVPMADLFSRNGPARLTLITCGGDFDSSVRSYVDNIVVTAVPG